MENIVPIIAHLWPRLDPHQNVLNRENTSTELIFLPPISPHNLMLPNLKYENRKNKIPGTAYPRFRMIEAERRRWKIKTQNDGQLRLDVWPAPFASVLPFETHPPNLCPISPFTDFKEIFVHTEMLASPGQLYIRFVRGSYSSGLFCPSTASTRLWAWSSSGIDVCTTLSPRFRSTKLYLTEKLCVLWISRKTTPVRRHWCGVSPNCLVLWKAA